ncbi:unnamed protein product, partial [Rodentolepis nana]|uniref:UPF0160 protein MYG1, mitochondrial n=1 Tax=Rodentolepis nana TaxID=102285 RepID=A0A0R3T048_RODNA
NRADCGVGKFDRNFQFDICICNNISLFLNKEIFLRHIMTSIKLGTHNGSFHCDEILALAMLRKLPEYQNAELIRSRDPNLLASCDVVFDVGGEFDSSRHRYDHHQPSFNMTIQDFHPSLKPAVKLSSAGLIYAHFGKRVIASIINEHSIESDIVNTLFTQVYKSFVAEVDAIDNGIAISSVPPNYTIDTDLSSRVGRHNPTWNMPDEDENECFMRAFEMVDGEFVEYVKSMAMSWYPARDIVKQAITARFSVHPSGYIMRITGPSCPWKAHFFDLEKTLVPGFADTSRQEVGRSDFRNRPVFMITERKTPNGTEYNVLTISCGQDQPFTRRVSLSAAFAGKRGEELSKLVGIDGAVFVHVNLFIGIHKTFEGALQMAVKSLEEAKYL